MNIISVGGSPAGLFFDILMKRRDPAHRITVIERHAAVEQNYQLTWPDQYGAVAQYRPR